MARTRWWLVVFLFNTASAGELALLVNGHAVHLEQRPGNENEENYGLGLQYDQQWRGDWLWFVFSSGFQSSQNEPAYNAGGGLRHRHQFSGVARKLHFDLGAAAVLLSHNGYRKGGPVAGVLPVASLGWSNFAVNAAFVPPVNERVVPLVFFQFMYSLSPGKSGGGRFVRAQADALREDERQAANGGAPLP